MPDKEKWRWRPISFSLALSPISSLPRESVKKTDSQASKEKGTKQFRSALNRRNKHQTSCFSTFLDPWHLVWNRESVFCFAAIAFVFSGRGSYLLYDNSIVISFSQTRDPKREKQKFEALFSFFNKSAILQFLRRVSFVLSVDKNKKVLFFRTIFFPWTNKGSCSLPVFDTSTSNDCK